jgi:hypothetical protein
MVQRKTPDKCPWGCTPTTTLVNVEPKDPQFPMRVKPVISCIHAKMAGDSRLVVVDSDWETLYGRWNDRK